MSLFKCYFKPSSQAVKEYNFDRWTKLPTIARYWFLDAFLQLSSYTCLFSDISHVILRELLKLKTDVTEIKARIQALQESERRPPAQNSCLPPAETPAFPLRNKDDVAALESRIVEGGYRQTLVRLLVYSRAIFRGCVSSHATLEFFFFCNSILCFVLLRLNGCPRLEAIRRVKPLSAFYVPPWRTNWRPSIAGLEPKERCSLAHCNLLASYMVGNTADFIVRFFIHFMFFFQTLSPPLEP